MQNRNTKQKTESQNAKQKHKIKNRITECKTESQNSKQKQNRKQNPKMQNRNTK